MSLGGVCLSAASERDLSIACATAAFRAVVRPDQVPRRGATTSIAFIFRVPVGFNWWWYNVFCFGRPSVWVSCRCGSRVDYSGFRLVSSRFVSFRLSNASARGVYRGSDAAVSCPGIDGRLLLSLQCALLSLARKREYWRRKCRQAGPRTQ